MIFVYESEKTTIWLSFFATTFKFEKKCIFETYFYFVDLLHQLRLRACAIISKM